MQPLTPREGGGFHWPSAPEGVMAYNALRAGLDVHAGRQALDACEMAPMFPAEDLELAERDRLERERPDLTEVERYCEAHRLVAERREKQQSRELAALRGAMHRRRRAIVAQAARYGESVWRIAVGWFVPRAAMTAIGCGRESHGAQAGHRRRRHVARRTSSADPGDDGPAPAQEGGLDAAGEGSR